MICAGVITRSEWLNVLVLSSLNAVAAREECSEVTNLAISGLKIPHDNWVAYYAGLWRNREDENEPEYDPKFYQPESKVGSGFATPQNSKEQNEGDNEIVLTDVNISKEIDHPKSFRAGRTSESSADKALSVDPEELSDTQPQDEADLSAFLPADRGLII